MRVTIKLIGVCLGLSILAGCSSVEVAKDAVELNVAFEWSDKSGCSSISPAMNIGKIPVGTKYLDIRLKDFDSPAYNHGGGVVEYSGGSVIPEGALPSNLYAGPCPPSGQHTYQFTVMALNADKSMALAVGKSEKKYPQ